MNKKQGEPSAITLPWESPRFRNWVKVARASQAVERAIADALKPLGMKPAHLDMLMNIHRHPGLSQHELAEKLIVGRSNITMLLPSLVERGLVRRVADRKDKRVQRLELTAPGTDRLMQALGLYANVIDKAMSAATPEECDAIGQHMARVVEALRPAE
jgi:DNA-binding MarR family transcriptional regulator